MLLLDIGNSALKAGFVENGQIARIIIHVINKEIVLDVINDVIAKANPSKILAACSNQDIKIDNLYALPYDFKIIRSSSEFNGLINGYKNPEQLGIDRWLNMICARGITKDACCVIDCGTCITYDEITTIGQHLGGFILSGKHFAQKSVSSLLKTRTDFTISTELGTDTKSAIASGAEFQFVSTLSSLINHFKTKNPDNDNIFISGGGAHFIEDHQEVKIRYIENMTIKGLLQIANHED